MSPVIAGNHTHDVFIKEIQQQKIHVFIKEYNNQREIVEKHLEKATLVCVLTHPSNHYNFQKTCG